MQNTIFAHLKQGFKDNSIIRYLLYTACFLLLAGFVNLVAQFGDPNKFCEGHIVEGVQLVLIITGGLILLCSACLKPDQRGLILILAGVLAMIAVREADNLLDDHLPFGGWKLPMALVVGCISWIFWRYRQKILVQLIPFARQPAIVFFWTGICVIIYAQMTGHEGFWKPLLQESYLRNIKRVNEETTEILGHFFLLLSSLEFLVAALRERSARILSQTEV